MPHPSDPEPSTALPYPYAAPSEPLSAPAFGPVFKGLAWAMVIALLVWYTRLNLDWQSPEAAWCAIVWAMLAYTAAHIQRSRIEINSEAIEQSWMWRRRVALQELAYLKVIRIRGLEQLVAPRIYTRTLSGTFVFFYCADRHLLEEFSRLGQALKEHAALTQHA